MMDFEKVLNMGRARGIEVEIFHQETTFSTINIEYHKIHSMDAVDTAGTGIRVFADGKIGFAFTTEKTQKDMERCFREAVRAARHSKTLKNFVFPSEKKFPSVNVRPSNKIERLSSGEATEHIQTMLDAVKAVNREIFVCEGHFGYGIEKTVIMNTAGVRAEFVRSACGITIATACPTPDSVSIGFEEAESPELDFDFAELGKNAASLAFNGRNPEKLEGGKKNVLLVAPAARNVIESTLLGMLQGHHAMRGESLFAGKLNEKVLGENISIIDDGLLENSLATAPFDDEGTPSRTTTLIDAGILKTFIFDAYTAAEFNLKTTGNGIRSMRLSAGRTFKSLPTPNFRNFVITSETASTEAILKDFSPCLVVYAVLGAHTANPITGNFAVNIPIVFEYMNGEMKPKKQGMLSGNIADYLNRRVMISKKRKNCYGTFTPTNFAMPDIFIPDAQITGS
ncbi:MAG: TldD/PmbA family protein [Thermoplasmata archaeon]|nr:TldD/PmbA family protein [Thermoplasmata archaeon]